MSVAWSSSIAFVPRAVSSGGEADVGAPIGRQLLQYFRHSRDLHGLEIAQRRTDRAAAEAAQVHGGLGGLRLSEFACQGPERIPEPVQVACRRRIAGFQRSYFDSRGVHEWCREHLAIIEAVASGDHAQAASRMRARLEQALIAAQAAAR
jgi:hypothetical protein